MKLTDIIGLVDDSIKLEDCKVHLACWNGKENPVDLYLAGNFEEWQARQNKKNFARKYIVSLINLPEKDKWLFAGCYEVFGHEDLRDVKKYYRYDTKEIDAFSEYSGRVVVNFKRRSRQSYPYLENVAPEIIVSEMKPEKISIAEFPGFNNVRISHRVLKAVVDQQVESWRSILSNVKGVYAIIDRSNGSIYVGSATGEDMIWQRWSSYANSGHGGNKTLKQLIKDNGEDYPMNYQYTILEIADANAKKEDVLERESFWKEVLCSRSCGYNEN